MDKKTNKKERIKATISALALALAIGGLGSLGSYAYFTDKAEAKNDLIVTMGNLDVNLAYTSNSKHSSPSQCPDENPQGKIDLLTKNFKIENRGSLKQNLIIKINEFTKLSGSGELSNITNKLNYTLTMKNNNSILGIYTGNLIDIENGKNIQELNPNEMINCELKVYIPSGMSDTDKKAIQNTTFNFDISVDAKQIDAQGGNN